MIVLKCNLKYFLKATLFSNSYFCAIWYFWVLHNQSHQKSSKEILGVYASYRQNLACHNNVKSWGKKACSRQLRTVSYILHVALSWHIVAATFLCKSRTIWVTSVADSHKRSQRTLKVKVLHLWFQVGLSREKPKQEVSHLMFFLTAMTFCLGAFFECCYCCLNKSNSHFSNMCKKISCIIV